LISVIVPVYLSKKEAFSMTEDCIETAKHHSRLEAEWIIVETESDFFRDKADIHIYEKKRTTCTKSINRGFKVASGDYAVLLTNDVFLKSGWDEHLLLPFKKKKDCGMSTLATTQLRHTKQDLIDEGIWCSVFMIPRSLIKKLDYFDECFVNSWDDTDLVMRVYLEGLKMYRNYNLLVEHEPGKTMYGDVDHAMNYKRNAELFAKKHEIHKEHRMFKILNEGWVL